VAAAALARVPLVHTKHGQNWPDNPRWVWLSRQMSRLTRTIIPVSADIERIVTRIEKVPARKVVKIVNGLDTEAFGAGDGSQESGVRARLGIEPEAFVVGSVGRLAWEKNYELLVGAFAALSQRAPGSRLILVGEGPYRERIAQAARAAGVFARCVLPGLQENVAPWLGALDVFCLSSLTEGTSVTLLEAGASGLPAVVTDVGGNAEIVQHGVTGLVVPSGDREALAGALLELQADLERRRRMGAAARRRVQECYSLERMVRAYLAVYESVSRDEGGAGEGS
jgi:glycosyltransferase involved in cell wall biosynthesis